MSDPLDLANVPVGTSPVPMATYRLSRLIRAGLADCLSLSSELGLVAWRICLGLSGNKPVAQRELVEFTDLEQAQVSRALKTMEDRGLIGSRRSDHDGRVRLFHLTAKGRKQFNTVLPAVSAYYAAIDEALTEDEQAQFLSMARRVAAASLTASRINSPDGNAKAVQDAPDELPPGSTVPGS